MLDDIRQTINKVWGDFFSNRGTSVAAGRKVVQNNLDLVYLGVGVIVLLGIMKFKDAILLAFYGGVPFLFDSGIFLESIPLLSRVMPRVTVLIDLGMGFGAVTVGISLGVVYTVYRLIGAVKMGVPYYASLKRDD